MNTLFKAAGFCLIILLLGVVVPRDTRAQNVALSHEEALAAVQPGLDQDSAQTVLNWWSALFAGNDRALMNLSGLPIILNGQAMTIDMVMKQFAEANVVSADGDWPMALLGIHVRPAIDPVTGTIDYKIDNKLRTHVRPDDRVVGLTLAQKLPDGNTQGMATVIHHYAQHLHTSRFRIVGIGD